MPRKKEDPTPNKDLHTELMEAFETYRGLVQKDRDMMEKEVQFIHRRGAQWDDWATQARGKRPRPEINLTVKKLEIVKGDQKQSRINAKIRATGSGTKERVAYIFEGLCRSVSNARRTKSARDSAFEEAVDSGMGAYMVLTDYESERTLDVEPCVKAIRNARNTVFWSCDGSDTQHRDDTECFVVDQISRDTAKRKWPKAKFWDRNFLGKNGPWKGWSTGEKVQICDHFRKEPYERTLALFTNGELYEIDAETKKVKDELAEEGVEIKLDKAGNPRMKTVTAHRVMHRVLSGSEVLEGPTEIPCSLIPVAMVYAFMYWDEDGRHPYGMARHAQDAQRKLNYEVGAMMEAAAVSAKDPLFVTREMIAGQEATWGRMGAENRSYYIYTRDQSNPNDKPFRLGAPAVQGALNMQMAESEQFIRDTVGIYSPSQGENQSGQSGRAVLALQAKGDTATYTIKDSLAAAVAYETECLIDIFQRVYDHDKQLRITREDGEEEEYQLAESEESANEMMQGLQSKQSGQGEEFINKEVVDRQRDKIVLLKDWNLGNYDVVVDIGPSYATQRVENANALADLFGKVPGLAQLMPDILLSQLDLSKAEDATSRARRAGILAGTIDPTPEEAKDIIKSLQTQQMFRQAMAQASPPDPMQQALAQMQLKKAENELLKEAAEIDKIVTERAKNIASAFKDMKDAPATPQLLQIYQELGFELVQALESNNPQAQPQQNAVETGAMQ